MNLILGAGLAGLSTSYHLGHEKCLILEAKAHGFGHVHSTIRDGYTWDEGPHVSFTKNDYVRNLFAAQVVGGFGDFPVRTVNYFKGHWIDHPAQSNLYQVPEPLRSRCLESFIDARNQPKPGKWESYRHWLDYAFGSVFREAFAERYTEKYWTLETKELSTDWIGERVFFPEVEDVMRGFKQALERPTHYISRVRYPQRGGFQSFCQFLARGARISYSVNICEINLKEKYVVYMDSGNRRHKVGYSRLISSIPLPDFLRLCSNLSPKVREAACSLRCSSLTLVNVTAPHPGRHVGNWFYVYDEDMLSTRINQTERLSVHNAPPGHTGVQVEIYHGAWKPLEMEGDALERRVVQELVEMGFIDLHECPHGRDDVRVHRVEVPWANVIFDHRRREVLNVIWRELEGVGLVRESDDLDAVTNWDSSTNRSALGSLIFAGRFGQWRYFWSDDCVLRGKQIAECIIEKS